MCEVDYAGSLRRALLLELRGNPDMRGAAHYGGLVIYADIAAVNVVSKDVNVFTRTFDGSWSLKKLRLYPSGSGCDLNKFM